MCHPAEYYTRFLLAQTWGSEEEQLELEDLNLTLKDYGLPEMQETQWEYLRATFEAPDNFRFGSKRHTETSDFMEEQKIYSMWHPNAAMKRVLKELVGRPQVTHTIHILLMGDVPADVICEKVNPKYRIKPLLTPDMIDYYRHYFWRVASLTYAEWDRMLEHDVFADHHIASLLCGDQQALFRAGFNPKYDPKQALRDTHRQVSFRIQYLAYKQDDRYTIDLLIKLSREQRSLYDKLYGEGGGLDEQAQEIRRFMMKHEIPDVKSLEELVGDTGSHSGDGGEED